MRILVCGGRDYNDDDYFYEIMNALNDSYNVDLTQGIGNKIKVIIHGGAKGADSMAREFARVNAIVSEEYQPDWEKYGKAAGMLRNQKMLTEGKPDLVVAFPGGKGTANMVKIAKEAGVEVREIT